MFKSKNEVKTDLNKVEKAIKQIEEAKKKNQEVFDIVVSKIPILRQCCQGAAGAAFIEKLENQKMLLAMTNEALSDMEKIAKKRKKNLEKEANSWWKRMFS